MLMKSIGNEYRLKLASVMQAAKGIITPKIVATTLGISRQEAGRILSRWNQHGWVKRIKWGVYIPIGVDDVTGDASIEDPWVLADRLYSPGYIGGFSAIKHWDFSDQLFETTTFFTTNKIKNKYPLIGSSDFQLKNISAYKVFGTQAVWRDNSKILISDPSKTIVDILDDPTIVGGMRVVQDVFLEYKDSGHFDIEKIISYSAKMNNKTILKRLGFLLESIGLYDIISDYDLKNRISAGYSLFDPSVENNLVIRKWKLKIPAVWKVSSDRKN